MLIEPASWDGSGKLWLLSEELSKPLEGSDTGS